MSSITQATHLYVTRAKRTCFIKVGITSDPNRRLRQAQTECPHEIQYMICFQCPRAYDVEQWIHEQLSGRRIRGEWFWVWRDAHIRAIVRRAIALRDSGDLPVALLPWEQTDPFVSATYSPPAPPRMRAEELLTVCRLMRAAGIRREDAQAAFMASGLPFNNNIWASAAPPPPAHVTPVAGRPTDADFPYQPIDGASA